VRPPACSAAAMAALRAPARPGLPSARAHAALEGSPRARGRPVAHRPGGRSADKVPKTLPGLSDKRDSGQGRAPTLAAARTIRRAGECRHQLPRAAARQRLSGALAAAIVIPKRAQYSRFSLQRRVRSRTASINLLYDHSATPHPHPPLRYNTIS